MYGLRTAGAVCGFNDTSIGPIQIGGRGYRRLVRSEWRGWGIQSLVDTRTNGEVAPLPAVRRVVGKRQGSTRSGSSEDLSDADFRWFPTALARISQRG
jgi:hypothetical protein